MYYAFKFDWSCKTWYIIQKHIKITVLFIIQYALFKNVFKKKKKSYNYIIVFNNLVNLAL